MITSGVLALGAICLSGYSLLHVRPVIPVEYIPASPVCGARPRQDVCEPLQKKSAPSMRFNEYFPPSQLAALLVTASPIRLIADGHPGFILHTITGFHRPEFAHYYGIICHLTPIPALSLLLCKYVQPTSLDTVPGFPSYCTGSLLTIPPSNTAQV